MPIWIDKIFKMLRHDIVGNKNEQLQWPKTYRTIFKNCERLIMSITFPKQLIIELHTATFVWVFLSHLTQFSYYFQNKTIKKISTHLCLFVWKASSKCFVWNHMSENSNVNDWNDAIKSHSTFH